MKTEKLEKHLLVIDDENEITKSLFRQFRRKYNVHTAMSGNEAFRIMEENPIQVVVSDQRMPGMTGVEFFSKIKEKYPTALKLILTGYSDIEAVVGAINEGQVFRYLTKPWNPIELDYAIAEAFEKYELITNNKRLMNKLKEVNASLEEKVKDRTQELEQANLRLRDLNIEKNKYIGIVAHDLLNPIGNAYSLSKILMNDYHEIANNEKIEYLKIIFERCSYSINLIGDFLDVSKIESGILDLDFKEWDYDQIISSCISHNELFARKKDQEIIYENNLSRKKVLCDKNKIEQVINNLLSNAIKYSAIGKSIFLKTDIESGALVTSVRDEGEGIADSEIDSIFKSYKTTSTKATGGEKSTGLGLAIVKKIVEAHKGEITVNSEVAVGSEFKFKIPVN